MTEKQLFDYFVASGMTPEGAAGLMGNLMAESGLRANNLENVHEKRLGMTDKSYTEAVNNGTYTNFVRDSAGYGLAQWTYWSRKQGLLDLAKKKKLPIDSYELQLEYLMYELTRNYPTVLKVLKSTKSIREASDIVLTQYERPADQTTRVKELRASYGKQIYDRCYANSKVTPNEVAEEIVKQLQAKGYDAAFIKGVTTSLIVIVKEELTKTVDELAKEVIAGHWGNGEDRKKRLEAAGYDYGLVQKRVNDMVAAGK